MTIYCNHPYLELKVLNDGKIVKHKAPFMLTKDQRKLVCEWVRELRLPNKYCSNLSKCVNLQEWKLPRMKSHDYHVFMERLMPIAFRDLLLELIWHNLTKVSLFFRDLCTSILKVDQIKKLEANVMVTLCKLEKIFALGFFDFMEHLSIHLPYEVRIGGLVQYRWM